jgi:hypothetical protein
MSGQNQILTYKHVPAQSGAAFTLTKGQILRVIDVAGEQVSDLVCFARQDSREYFSSGRTLDYNGKLYLSVGDILYSDRSRPMMTIMEDKVGKHTCLYAPCSQEMFRISYGINEPQPNCLDNLSENLAPFAVKANHMPTPINLFLNVTISEGGKLNIHPPRSQAGDYVALRAEMDLIIGLTACSAGACNNYHNTPIAAEIYGPA